jgi:hypothetical protein
MPETDVYAESLQKLMTQLIASNLAPLYVRLRSEGKSREDALVETLTAWTELWESLERLPQEAFDA